MKKLTLLFAIISLMTIISTKSQTWPPTGMAGDGFSETTAWEITTPEHLAALAAYVNAGNGSYTYEKYYILMNDIDLTNWQIIEDDTCGWKPIGNFGNFFRGNFNGNKKIIKNLKINRSDESFVGLFGCIWYASINNLGVEDCDIVGYESVGGLVGSCGGLISNCYVTGNVKGYYQIGGMAGNIYDATIVNSRSGCNVCGDFAVGGLVGRIDGYSTINKAFTSGSVSAVMSQGGGLIGSNMGRTNITESYATSSVCGNGNLGGLIGNNDYNSPISNCYATGNVDGTFNVGGLIGINGIESALSYCYVKGKVKGNNNVGGLVGANFSKISNCVAANDSVLAIEEVNRIVGYSTPLNFNSSNYALSDMILMKNGTLVIPPENNNNGISKDLVTLQSLSFYNAESNWFQNESWNINPPSGIWKICDSEGFPFFRWQNIFCLDEIFTIIATADKNGSIDPLGNILVEKGQNKTFTFIANDNYTIKQVLVDGFNVPSAVINGKYTFENVTDNHSIRVDFSTIGIEENIVENKIVLYPNPTMGMLTIESEKLSIMKIEIFDMYSRKQNVKAVNSSSVESKFDISQLSKGIYFVKIFTEIGEVVNKVVKQ